MNRFALGLLVALAGTAPAGAADIVIINNDSAGEGLNDPSPRPPVGGNEGETLGEQRRIALEFVAGLLGGRIQSDVPIRVAAQFNPQDCSENNATLATSGAVQLVDNFPNAPFRDTFYPIALANAFAGNDLSTSPDIRSTFNSRLDDDPSCLSGIGWYYGLDGQTPSGFINFVNVATHEFTHGLGFATFTDLETGAFFQDTPDIYALFIGDLTANKRWPQMNDSERMASAVNDGNIVWCGQAVSAAAPDFLDQGTTLDGEGQERVLLYAPNPFEEGSSISHWDTSLSPNALMEPFVTRDVDVLDGLGLATCQLLDIGWDLTDGTTCPDAEGSQAIGSGGLSPACAGIDFEPLDEGSGGSDGGGGGGGTCSLVGSGTPDPLWPTMLLLALAGVAWRIRRQG